MPSPVAGKRENESWQRGKASIGKEDENEERRTKRTIRFTESKGRFKKNYSEVTCKVNKQFLDI